MNEVDYHPMVVKVRFGEDPTSTSTAAPSTALAIAPSGGREQGAGGGGPGPGPVVDTEWIVKELLLPEGYTWTGFRSDTSIRRIFALVARYKDYTGALALAREEALVAARNAAFAIANGGTMAAAAAGEDEDTRDPTVTRKDYTYPPELPPLRPPVAVFAACMDCISTSIVHTWERAKRSAARRDILQQIDLKLAEWSETLTAAQICHNTIDFIAPVLPGTDIYTAVVKPTRPTVVVEKSLAEIALGAAEAQDDDPDEEDEEIMARRAEAEDWEERKTLAGEMLVYNACSAGSVMQGRELLRGEGMSFEVIDTLDSAILRPPEHQQKRQTLDPGQKVQVRYHGGAPYAGTVVKYTGHELYHIRYDVDYDVETAVHMERLTPANLAFRMKVRVLACTCVLCGRALLPCPMPFPQFPLCIFSARSRPARCRCRCFFTTGFRRGGDAGGGGRIAQQTQAPGRAVRRHDGPHAAGPVRRPPRPSRRQVLGERRAVPRHRAGRPRQAGVPPRLGVRRRQPVHGAPRGVGDDVQRRVQLLPVARRHRRGPRGGGARQRDREGLGPEGSHRGAGGGANGRHRQPAAADRHVRPHPVELETGATAGGQRGVAGGAAGEHVGKAADEKEAELRPTGEPAAVPAGTCDTP